MLAVDIKLNDVSILDQITGAEIVYDRAAVHNTLKITGADPALFDSVSPAYDGVQRLTVSIGEDDLLFLLEPPKQGNDRSFSFGGRSLSAKEEIEYAGTVTALMDSPADPAEQKASFFVNEIAQTQTVSWDITDFDIPDGYQINDAPMQAVSEIASAFGAVCRCDDSGAVHVVPRYPYTAPPWSSGAVPMPAADYTLDVVDGIWGESYQREYRDRFDMIDVHALPAIDSPEIENVTAFDGDDMLIRVWWPLDQEDATPDLFSSSGTLTKETTNRTLTRNERVTFQDYTASVSKRIKTLVSVEWVGDSGGTVSYRSGEKRLTCTGLGGIADIEYTTVCHEYTLSGTSEYDVLIGFAPTGLDAPYRFKIGADPSRPAETVRNTLLVTEDAKRMRGLSEIIDSMDRYRLQVSVPLEVLIKDGDIMELSAPLLGCSGKFMVSKVTTHIESVKLYSVLELVQCIF